MTFVLGSAPKTPIAARGAGTPLPTFWQGLGAGISSAWVTSNANYRTETMTEQTRVDRITSIQDRLPLADLNARIAERYGIFTPVNREPQSVAEAVSQYGPDIALAMADEMALADPDAWSGVDLSQEGVEAEVTAKLTAEFQEAQQMLDLMGTGRGVAEFVGGMVGMTADLRNVPFLLAGGGGGSFARIVGREALLNTAAEAATMPGQMTMAERLNIPAPNVVQQLSLAAVAGGALGGLVEAGSRGLTYFMGTRRSGLTSPRHPASEQLLVDQAEDAFLNKPNPFESIIRAIEDDPVIAPREPLIPEPLAPITRDSAMADLQPSIDAARADFGTRTSPLISHLRRGHIPTKAELAANPMFSRQSQQVHPDGNLGQSLRAADITPKSHPGLFSRKGRKDFDNLVGSEWEENFPGIMDATKSRRDDLNGYLDPDGFADVVARAASGDYSWLASKRYLDALERQMTDLADDRVTTATQDFMSKRQDPRGFFVDKDFYDFEGDAAPAIAADFDAWAQDRGFAGILTRGERDEILATLQRSGGDAEYLVERALERELDDLGAGNGSATEAAANSGRTGGEGSLDSLPFDDGPGATRAGSGEGSQLPGIAPVSQRQTLEAKQNARLIGTARAADEGLFDLGARQQMDWLDKPNDATPLLDQRTADARDWADENADAQITMEDGRVMSLSAALADLDAGDIFSARIDLCGKAPA